MILNVIQEPWSRLLRGFGPTAMRGAVMCFHGIRMRSRDCRVERNLHLLVEWKKQAEHLVEREGYARLPGGAERAISESPTITFDDGYANNLLAAEELRRRGMTATIFVSTGALGRQGMIWTVELSLLMLRGEAKALEVEGNRWSLATREEREAAFQAIRFPMKRMSAGERRRTMEQIRAQFPEGESLRILNEFPSLQMLTWDEVRQLSAEGFEIGSHGVDHENHHAAQDPEVRRRELVESKAEIERQIGKPCRFFAYPNGDFCDHSPREVEAAGYEAAFTTQPGFITSACNRFLLPRVSPGGTVAKLKQQLRKLEMG